VVPELLSASEDFSAQMLAVLPPCCNDVDTLLLRLTREDVP